MERGNYDSNEVILVGRLESWFKYDHNVKDEIFFLAYILVQRPSGAVDRIPLSIKASIVENLDKSILNQKVYVYGYIVTNMVYNHFVIKVRVSGITPVANSVEDYNEVMISGVMHGECPYLRMTSSGKEICDFVVTSRRKYGKVTYLPVIAWNRVARYIIKNFHRGNIYMKARFQSREEQEVLENGWKKTKIIYELSVFYATCYFEPGELKGGDYG